MPMGSFPAVLGHEGAGVIRQLGEDLKGSNSDLQVGDRVILGYSSCMACSSCENGRKGACERIAETNFVGTRGGKDEDSAIHLPLDGHDGGDDSDGSGRSVRSLFFGQSSFSKLAVVDVRSVIKYPGPTEDLAFLAPLGCGYMTGAATVLNVLKPKPTSTVAIVGLGAVGLSALMAAKYAKVEQILAVDIVESRLRQAASLGATKCADSSKYDTVQDVIREVFPRGADYIIDATGLKSIIVSGVRALAHGGTFAIVGMPRPHEILEIEALDMLTQCKTLIGITGGYCDPQQVRGCHYYPLFIIHTCIGLYPWWLVHPSLG